MASFALDPFGSPVALAPPACGWQIVRGQDWPQRTDAHRALEGLLASFFAFAVQRLHERMPLATTGHAIVILGGPLDAQDWDVDEDALGFHAVMSELRNERESCDPGTAAEAAGTTAETETETQGYFEVSGHNVAVINLDALLRSIIDDVQDDATIEAALVTLPHEMVHVLAWLRASGGRTPIQVFDDDGGELEIKAVLERAEHLAHAAGHSGGYGCSEDEAEQIGGEIVTSWATLEVIRSAAWQALRGEIEKLRRAPQPCRP